MNSHQIQTLFVGLAAILVLSRLLAAAARKVGQPPVVGEILAGILVGPTLLGGAVAAFLFPPDVRPMLTALADLGLVLFLFVIGYELDLGKLRGHGRLTTYVSLASVTLPFLAGALLAYGLAGRHATPAGSTVFVLFVGTAMSATALPVLARILDDRELHRTRVGGLALASAASGDLIVWGLLALVLALADGPGQWRTLLAPVYLALMFWGVRPLLRRLLAERAQASRSRVDRYAVVLGGLLLSCWAAEWLGVHFILGAFVFGVVMPRSADPAVRFGVVDSLEQVSKLLLLPVFFVISGLNVDLSGFGTRRLTELAAILLTAIGSKFLAVYGAARLGGLPSGESGVLATLMNTRGLTEIVILMVGLQMGLIGPELYTMMVVMAVVTTMMTGPVLSLLRRRTPAAFPDPAPAPRDAVRSSTP